MTPAKRIPASMLSFLWHFRGSVRLDGATSSEAALDRVAATLTRQGKTVSNRGPSQIAFHASVFDLMAPSWRALVLYDRGRVWIERDLDGRVLRYDLRSLHVCVFCAGSAVLFFAMGTAFGDLWQGLTAGAVAFTWVYGGNLVIAAMRVPGLFRRSARNPKAHSA